MTIDLTRSFVPLALSAAVLTATGCQLDLPKRPAPDHDTLFDAHDYELYLKECQGDFSREINVPVYDIDPQTGLCYSRTISGSVNSRVHLTVVPATPEVLKQVDQVKLAKMQENGVQPVIWSVPALNAAPAPKP